jgi:hypothetical protein
MTNVRENRISEIALCVTNVTNAGLQDGPLSIRHHGQSYACGGQEQGRSHVASHVIQRIVPPSKVIQSDPRSTTSVSKK